MQYIKDHKICYIFDPWDYLGPKRRNLLEQSWAGLFRKYLLEELPVDKVAKHFHSSMGRPTKELYTAIGTLVLQQLHDLSDSEVVSTLAFDTRWHYALDITKESDEDKTMAERTLREYRKIVIDEKLDGYLFGTSTDKLINAFEVDVSRQRMDSSHICSNMHCLGRISLFVNTIKKFLMNLKRRHRDIFDTEISKEIASRYLKKEENGCFAQVKPSKAKKTLKMVSEDLLLLIERFKSHQEVSRLNSFHLLKRVLADQCTVSNQEEEDQKVKVKPSKEVASDSLQNPSDPDATYDGHKGQGYQVQIMETFIPDDERDETKPNLITYVEVEPAHKSDTEALIPAIKKTQRCSCAPKELEADALYGSDENIQAAEELGVKVNAPVMGKKTSDLGLADFSFHKNTNQVKRCPKGQKPEKSWTTKKGQFVSLFLPAHCQDCSHKNQCPVQEGKAGNYLRYSVKQLRLAKRRIYENTQEFQDKYRWRAGIEGTNSYLKSATGAGHLRVRGLSAVTYCVTLKALALNILRASSARKAKILAKNSLDKEILDRIPDRSRGQVLSFFFFTLRGCFIFFARHINRPFDPI